jgi:hypothetical protein
VIVERVPNSSMILGIGSRKFMGANISPAVILRFGMMFLELRLFDGQAASDVCKKNK